ncbi:hypothetical protein BWI17_15095 [Betaproteobacteria bacterium GR16-43]|nr:hypothetical protein BWI17_15095 [Betaproteobacteria bacterium GR16-43]
MSAEPKPIEELHDVDAWRFQSEVVTRYRPVVMRGLVAQWPAVARARESIEAFAAYLTAFDSGKQVDVLMVPPHARGRIFYNENLSGFNYSHDKLSVGKVASQLLRYAKFENRPGVAVQSAPVAECLPGFEKENVLPLLERDVAPRVWMGNAIVTPAHFDESSNVACVVAGRRRFTLLPPEQVTNLYVGPLDYAPTGTPISMVSFREPDFAKFPRFREAMAAAFVADLGPGDAIYIPPLWWHHVESLERFNVLVNYWWRPAMDVAEKANSALNVLLLALLNLRDLPPDQRAAWRSIFDHYVFSADESVAAHIPVHRRSVLGEISPKLAAEVRAFLVTQLEKKE